MDPPFTQPQNAVLHSVFLHWGFQLVDVVAGVDYPPLNRQRNIIEDITCYLVLLVLVVMFHQIFFWKLKR